MRRRIFAVALTGGAAALTLALPATSSLAATAKTWQVSPGGSITMTSTVVRLKDTSTGKSLHCTSSSGAGTLKSGSGLSGTGIGSIKSVSYSTCSGPKTVALTMTAAGLPWTLNATGYNSTTGRAHFTISGIKLTVSGTGCKATVAGASATAAGDVKANYLNSTGVFTITAAKGNLHVYAVTGCTGLFNTGDPVTLRSVYTVSPKQTITKS